MTTVHIVYKAPMGAQTRAGGTGFDWKFPLKSYAGELERALGDYISDHGYSIDVERADPSDSVEYLLSNGTDLVLISPFISDYETAVPGKAIVLTTDEYEGKDLSRIHMLIDGLAAA